MKNILVLTYWSYRDALIQTYTLPYVRIIRKTVPQKTKIFLFTLEQSHIKLTDAEKDSMKSRLREEGIIWLDFNYYPFGLKAMLHWAFLIPYLTGFIFRKNISHIHCWCTPAGAMGYLLSKICFRKLVLDSYEPHAEAMVENGTWSRKGIAFRILFYLEKLQSHRAKEVVSATEGMRKYAQEKYGALIRNFYVKPACVNLELFSGKNLKKEDLIQELLLENKIVAVYAGKFGGIYLEDEVFAFLKVAYDYWGDRFRILLLTGHSDAEIQKYCRDNDLDEKIIIKRFVNHSQVPDYMGLADFGLTPVKPIPTKRYCTPIKNGEYWALGLPIVTTKDISDDSDIIEQEEVGAVIHDFSRDEYLTAVKKIDALLKLPKEEVYKKIRNLAVRYRSFEIASGIYSKIYG